MQGVAPLAQRWVTLSFQLVARFGAGRLMASVVGTATIHLAGYLIWSQVFSFSLTSLFVSVSAVGSRIATDG